MFTTSLVSTVLFGLAAGRSFWSSKPASYGPRSSDEYVLKTAYPLGNGRLGAMPFGPPGSQKLLLNVDSLWSGGPFEIANYSGGNPPDSAPKYPALPSIRSKIFENGTGEVDGLLGSNDNYGSYHVLGNLTVVFDGFSNYSDYKRTLDLATGVHTTEFDSDGAIVKLVSFCSYPDQVCVWSISSDSTVPPFIVGLENLLAADGLVNVTCGDDNHVRLRGLTQEGPPEGMRYESLARLSRDSTAASFCKAGQLSVMPVPGRSSITIVLGAGTNFDQTKGTTQHNYFFKGVDPSKTINAVVSKGVRQCTATLLRRHKEDFSALESKFALNLPDQLGSVHKETADLIAGLEADGADDPFLDGLLFDYSRYLLISSSRANSLPANLQGRWNEEIIANWSSDYHANINLQMNYWPADQTGLHETQGSLWDYMRLNWVPRGSETARLLYDAPGWVAHNEMNIFGHTAMKGSAGWANYPTSGAWMMQHVWDYFDYTQDVIWLKEIGYPLLKGVGDFWLSQLQEDLFSGDGSLVVIPCNSPEHGPTTFGCAHDQQEVHQVFDNILSSAIIVGEANSTFLGMVSSALTKMDKGLHITEWGGVKEWKIPDSYGFDVENTHRHLSHLTGWYPGASVSSYLGGYSNATIQAVLEKTLVVKGNGKSAEANAGWGKVWRSAAWARLNNTDQAYYHLKYAVEINAAPNGFSMYEGKQPPFQIDSNQGYGGAVLSMLCVDLPLSHNMGRDTIRTVVLGPAIPRAWAGGSVIGLRIRGGGIVDFEWDNEGIVFQATLKGSKTSVRLVNKEGAILG